MNKFDPPPARAPCFELRYVPVRTARASVNTSALSPREFLEISCPTRPPPRGIAYGLHVSDPDRK
jgi:hypothetical protein